MGTDLTSGTLLAGYRIERLIGRGGMSVVYLAEHSGLKRKVALKLLASDLASDEAFRRRFVRESELAASLDHPNIIPIYEAGESGGHLYIAMRYVDGRDLKSVIREEGPLASERAVLICAQVAYALDAAHRKGLVHRDVKPANVLLAPGIEASDAEHAYVSDFGLTKRASSVSGLTGTGQFMGTIDYASPEQIRGDTVDGRTDQYALACMLFECLTGEVPFDKEIDVAVLYGHLNDSPPRPSESRPALPVALDDVVAKGMAKDPAERFESCGALVRAARDALGMAPGAQPLVVPHRLWRPTLSRKPRLAAAVAVALAVLIAVIVVTTRLVGSHASSPTAGTTPNTAALVAVDRVVRVDPSTGHIKVEIKVGKSPTAVATGEGTVWVTNFDDDSVTRIDPTSGKVQATIPVGNGPQGIAVGEGSVWVADRFSQDVVRIDPGSNRATKTFPVEGATDVAVASGIVWVGTTSPQAVTEINPANDTESPPIPLKAGDHLAADAGAVWVGGGARLVRVTSDRRVEPADTVPEGITGLAVGSGSVWVAAGRNFQVAGPLFAGKVYRIDPHTRHVEASVQIGKSLTGIAVDRGTVWIAGGDGMLSRIIAVSNSVEEPISIGARATDVAVGYDSVWVTVDAP